MPPAEPGKPGEAPVGGHPFAPRLDRQGREEGIRHPVALRVGLPAQPGEDRPVLRTGEHRPADRLFSQRAGEVHRLRQLAGFPEDPWMGDDPHEAAEYQIGAGEAGVTVDCAVQPGPVILVVGNIFSERVHEHTVRDDVRAKLRSSIKRLLVSQGYPPDKQPATIKLVLEQMESIAPRYAIDRT